MVQLFYYEIRGQKCKQLIRHDGLPIRVQLHAYEGWAQPTLCSYLLLRFPWYHRKRVQIGQVVGGVKQASLRGRIISSGVDGCMLIQGRLKSKSNKAFSSSHPSSSPTSHDYTHFQLSLTSAVSEEDFLMGYCLTGFYQLGSKHDNCWEMTHYAMVKRKGY